MNKKISIVALALLLGLGGYFLYQKMNPPKVGASAKEFNDSKVAKLRAGMPLFDNMIGKWVSLSNTKKTIEVTGSKFIETINGVSKEYDFASYLELPEACYPANVGGKTLGFSLKNGSEVRCFEIKELMPKTKFGFRELLFEEKEVESFEFVK